MATGTLLTEKLYLRTEMQVPLTTLQNDENHQYVANVWKTSRAYKVGMIVYYSLDITTDGTTLGSLAWYVCQSEHTAGTFITDIASNHWKQIGEGTGINMVINNTAYPGITLGQGLSVDNCGILSNTAAGFWEQTTGGDAIHYSSGPVLVGDTTLPSSNDEQFQIVGNAFITGNIIIAGTVDGIDLSGFFGINGSGISSGETWDDHKHTIGSNAAYHSQLADVSVSSLADNDILQYDSSTDKWQNVAINNIVATHTLGAGQSDINAAVSTSPSLNQILYYDGAEWNKLTISNNSSTGLAGGNFAHNHDGRYYTEAELNAGQLNSLYYTETELQTSGGAAVHFNNLTNVPGSVSGETIYSGDGELASDREIYLGGYKLRVIQGTASQSYVTGLTVNPIGNVAIGTITGEPSATLEVYKPAGTDDIEPQFRISVAADSSIYTDFTVQENGPAGSLRINPSGTGGVKIIPTTNNLTTFQVLQTSGSSMFSSTPIFDVDTTNRRAGINTASPEAAFHIRNEDAGEISFMTSDGATSENIFSITGEGKVGINLPDTSPTHALHVGGEIKAAIQNAGTNLGTVLTMDANGVIKYRDFGAFKSDLELLDNAIWLNNTSGFAYLNGEILRLGIGYDANGNALTNPLAQVHIKSHDDDIAFLITDGGTGEGTHFAVDNEGILAFNSFVSAQHYEASSAFVYPGSGHSNVVLAGADSVSLSFGYSTTQNSAVSMIFDDTNDYFAISRPTHDINTVTKMHSAFPTTDGKGYEQFLLDCGSAPNSFRIGIPTGYSGASKSSNTTGAGSQTMWDKPAVAIGTPYSVNLDAALTISASSYPLLRIKDDSTGQGTFLLVDEDGNTSFKPGMMTNGKSVMNVASGFINGRELPMVNIGGPSDQAGNADQSTLLIYADGQDAFTVVDNTTSQGTLFSIKDSAVNPQATAQGGTQFYGGHVIHNGLTLPAMHVSVTDIGYSPSANIIEAGIYPAIAIGSIPRHDVTFNLEGNQTQDSVFQILDREATGTSIKLFDFKIDQLQPKLAIGRELDPQASLHIYSDGISPLIIEDGSTNSIGEIMHIDDENNIMFLEYDNGPGAHNAMTIHTKTNTFDGNTTPHVVIGSNAIDGNHHKSQHDDEIFAALTIKPTPNQPPFIIRDSSTGDGTQFMVNSTGEVVIGSDFNGDTGSPSAKLFIQCQSQSGLGTESSNEVAFRIDNSNPGPTTDATPFIIRNGGVGDGDFHVGVNKVAPVRTIDAYSSGNGHIRIEALAAATMSVHADSDVNDGTGIADGKLTLSAGGSFVWSLKNMQSTYNTLTDVTLGGSRGDRNMFVIHCVETYPFAIQQEAATHSLTLLENHKSFQDQQFPKPAVMIGKSPYIIAEADAGEACSLNVATNGNGGFQVTDSSTGEDLLFKIHETGNVEIKNGQVYSHVKQTTAAATTVVDFDGGNVQKVTLTAAHTNLSFTGHKEGASYTLFIIQDEQGSRTVDIEETTGGYDLFWQSGVIPIMSTTPLAVDIITFVCDGYNLFGSAAYNFQRVTI